MANKRSGDRQPKTTGRKALKYVGIPVDLWERLERWAKRDERTTNWAAKRIISQFLDSLEPDQQRG